MFSDTEQLAYEYICSCPKNKKPLIRYHIIDRCIRNTGRMYAYEDLITEINDELSFRGFEPIGKTTFYQDIKDMQVEFQAPIETYWYDRKKYYRYSDPKYQFGNQPLNQGEVDHLKESAMILSRFSGIPGFEWIDEVISKLELGTYEHVNNPAVISFQANEYLKGREHIGPLFKSIVNREVIDVKYQTFSSQDLRTHQVHPYHLKEYDSRWYLFGYYTQRDSLLPLSIDRIKEITIRKDIKFIDNDKFDFSEYFEDFIGIRKETKPVEKIELRFNSTMAPYVQTKPLHGSQKKVKELDDKSLEISIEVIPNYELDSLIFSFRDGVEVLSPEFYRQHIKVLLEDSLSSYS